MIISFLITISCLERKQNPPEPGWPCVICLQSLWILAIVCTVHRMVASSLVWLLSLIPMTTFSNIIDKADFYWRCSSKCRSNPRNSARWKNTPYRGNTLILKHWIIMFKQAFQQQKTDMQSQHENLQIQVGMSERGATQRSDADQHWIWNMQWFNLREGQ